MICSVRAFDGREVNEDDLKKLLMNSSLALFMEKIEKAD